MADAVRLAELPLAEGLERFAARTPAPGGGSAAATGCALAAALLEMASRFAPGDAAIATVTRAAQLRGRALELAEEDQRAYGRVFEAAQTAAGPEREARVSAARADAAQPPLELAALAAELAGLAARAVAKGNPNLAGDAITATLLAEAACRAADALVRINLACADADPSRERSAQHVAVAAGARERALTAVGETTHG